MKYGTLAKQQDASFLNRRGYIIRRNTTLIPMIPTNELQDNAPKLLVMLLPLLSQSR